MAHFLINNVRYEKVEKPMFAELRASTKYFGKKAEDLDIFEQQMSELFISMKRVRPGDNLWDEIEQLSPVDIISINDDPEPEAEFVPDPLDDGTQTGVSG